MARNSRIEWTHHTFNPWWGCERVSPACKHCYAETWAHRLGLDLWSKGAPRRVMSDAYWSQPIRWNHDAAAADRRERVFCASMADCFEDRADLDGHRERLWRLIDDTPNLDWLLLTKRPQHVKRLAPWGNRWPANVWLGATVETQKWADKRIPLLLENPAAVSFLSCEPLLGPLDLTPWFASAEERSIDWVICGGESGHRARPMNPHWALNLRNQCRRHGVAFHFKQWGNWLPATNGGGGPKTKDLTSPEGRTVTMVNVGKKAAGRKLDGRTWDELPHVQ